MMLSAWIAERLVQVPELSGRVYPTLGMVEAAAPYAVYGIISAVGLTTLNAADLGMYRGVVQVSVFSPQYGQAHELVVAIRERLAGDPDPGVGLANFLVSDLGRETATGLYQVLLRAEFLHCLEEA